MLRQHIPVCLLITLALACSTRPVGAQEDDLRRALNQTATNAGIAEPETKVFALQWSHAAEAVEVLRQLIGGGAGRFDGDFGGGRAQRGAVLHADSRTNSIFAKATPAVLAEIEAILQRLDAESASGSMRIEVTVWEVDDHDGAFEKAVAKEFKSALPVELSRAEVNEGIIPKLVQSRYLIHPVELRTSVSGQHHARMTSGYRRPIVETAQNGKEAYGFHELGTTVGITARRAGDAYLMQLEITDEREARKPTSSADAAGRAAEPPTWATTELNTTLIIRNNAAEVHLIGGAGRERGVRLLAVIAVSEE